MLPEKATLGDLVKADIELARMYNECRARHRALTEVVK